MNNINVKTYNDCLIIIFNLMALQDFQFNALMNFIDMNKKANLIKVLDMFKEEDDTIHIVVGGIKEGNTSEFIAYLQAETLEVIVPQHIDQEYLPQYSTFAN